MNDPRPPLEKPPPSPFRPLDRHPLPVAARMLLWGTGVVLFLLGLAGLVLPGLQGILLLVAAAAVLSAASDTVRSWLRQLFRRWPKGWRRVEKARRSVRGWFHKKS